MSPVVLWAWCFVPMSPLSYSTFTSLLYNPPNYDTLVLRLLVYCNELAVNNIAILCDGIRSELVMLHVLEVLHRSISVRHVSPRHHPHEDRTVRPYGYDICYGLALDVIQSLPSHQGQWSHPFGIDLVVG